MRYWYMVAIPIMNAIETTKSSCVSYDPIHIGLQLLSSSNCQLYIIMMWF